MKFFILAASFLSAIAASTAATVSAEQALEAGQLLTDKSTILEDRAPAACTSSPKCKCNGIRGQFCGLGYTAGGTVYCKIGNVYECNPNGNTCSYGVRKSCQKCNKLKC